MSEPTLPGFDYTTTASPVHAAYAAAIAALRETGNLRAEHEGLAANLLKLATVIDTERKGYAIAHATAQAHDIMKTLLELMPKDSADPFDELMRDLDRVHPRPGT